MINSAISFSLDFFEVAPTLSLMRGTYDLLLITILFHLIPKMETNDRRIP
jgi:hypothetical protein